MSLYTKYNLTTEDLSNLRSLVTVLDKILAGKLANFDPSCGLCYSLKHSPAGNGGWQVLLCSRIYRDILQVYKEHPDSGYVSEHEVYISQAYPVLSTVKGRPDFLAFQTLAKWSKSTKYGKRRWLLVKVMRDFLVDLLKNPHREVSND